MKAFANLPALLVAALMKYSGTCNAFVTTKHYHTCRELSLVVSNRSLHVMFSSDAQEGQPQQPPANLVGQGAFVTAIDTLKRDMGIEPIPEDQRPPMYAIGKLVAELPLELVSGIRLADCETLTLISQLMQPVIDATGMQSLDTIVAIRAGPDGNGGYGYEGGTSGVDLNETAAIYTAAINYAVENKLGSIELELNRLVPMRESPPE